MSAVFVRSSHCILGTHLLYPLADRDVAEDVKELALASVVVLAGAGAQITVLVIIVPYSAVESGLSSLELPSRLQIEVVAGVRDEVASYFRIDLTAAHKAAPLLRRPLFASTKLVRSLVDGCEQGRLVTLVIGISLSKKCRLSRYHLCFLI